MFWVTLWPLVLGFGISGAVQSFASRDALRRKLGDHRPAAVARGHGLRDGLVVVLVRGDGHGQVAVRARRGLRRRHGLHVRLDQPGHRARHRAGRAHGVAVRRQRVRRRRDHDRPPRLARRAVAARAPRRRRPRPSGGREPTRTQHEHEHANAAKTRRGGPERRRRAVAHPAALAGQVGRQRHLHDGRPDHGAARARHRLRRRRLPGRARADLGLAGRLRHRARVLDEPRERHRRSRSSRSSASSAPSATFRWRRRCGTAASRSAA